MSNTAKKQQSEYSSEAFTGEKTDTEFSYNKGDLVLHEFYGYRGVIINQDECFRGDEEQLEKLKITADQASNPWYQILIDGTDNVAYVEEANLKGDASNEPIDHPMIFEFFDRFENGRYLRILH